MFCIFRIQGIVLVHDLTNSKSHDHLRMWLADAVTRRFGGEFDAEMFADLQVRFHEADFNYEYG